MNDFKFKKRLGQNFLTDESILDEIIEKSNIEEESLVIEIGCGAGALTKRLVKHFKYVIGYEIDNSLKPTLDKINSSNLKIIYDDFLKRNIEEDIKDYKYNKLYVIANLPYYITTPIIQKLIDENINIYKIVIMVQKEVGDRLTSKPNSKDYSSLSVFINYNFEVKKLINVSRNCFHPKPNVDSIVIELLKKDEKIKPTNEKIFFKLIKDSFRQKRKTLKNNLKDYNFDLIEEVLNKHNLSNNVRAEQIDLNIFIDIANKLSE